MLRNSELKNILRQLNKSPRTSLLKEDEKKRLLEVLEAVKSKEITKENKKVAKIDKKK